MPKKSSISVQTSESIPEKDSKGVAEEIYKKIQQFQKEFKKYIYTYLKIAEGIEIYEGIVQ